MKKGWSIRKIAISAVIGAVYAGLTIVLAPISYGPVQLRVAEALCVLPFFFPASVWGLTVGCVIANLLSSYGILDIVFGSLATLLATLCISKLKIRWLAPLPLALFNGVIVGAVIALVSGGEAFWRMFVICGAEVALGELAVSCALGLPLLALIPRIKALNCYIKE